MPCMPSTYPNELPATVGETCPIVGSASFIAPVEGVVVVGVVGILAKPFGVKASVGAGAFTLPIPLGLAVGTTASPA